MPTTLSSALIPSQIQTLLDKREQHIDAISKIDHTLAGVAAALGNATVTASVAKPAAIPAATKAPAAKGKKRSSFSVSASDLVLAFVETNKNPTTKEIMQHLASKGRTASSGSNALSTLAKAKKLKRTSLGNGLGSRYSLP